MFAERFDALMNIAEISNSSLARAVYMNPSQISRLRTGARVLPKKHDYLTPICLYLADHFKKDYQINALQKLTGIGIVVPDSSEDIALYLENWLLEQEQDSSSGRLVSGFSRSPSKSDSHVTTDAISEKMPKTYAEYLYGDAGKRKAVEQFFLMILQEEKPQTIYLFSDENMSWLYEDPVFAARWRELFTGVILKGNRVQIIHTISRNMNEIIEAVAKWTPIYATGMIEPYYYPRLRDGIFQHTMFIAPNTAAILSSSVEQDTKDMLNLFITDRAALNSLVKEYKNYLALCRPLMSIFTEQNINEFKRTIGGLCGARGDAYLCCNLLPLFTIPETLVSELAKQSGNKKILSLWKKYFSSFEKNIKNYKLSLILLTPESALKESLPLLPPPAEFFSFGSFTYSKEQYLIHLKHLKKLEKQYKNLSVEFRHDLGFQTMLYVKEEVGVIMLKTDSPMSAFFINEQGMVNAFWDYLKKHRLS